MNETVEHPEDLATLPVGTVIKLGQSVYVHDPEKGIPGLPWLQAGDDRPISVDEFRKYCLELFPATILYKPETTT